MLLKRALLPAALGVLLLLQGAPAAAVDYVVRQVISVRPGERQTREFLVAERFSVTRPGPVEAYLVYSWGISEPAGALHVELSVAPGTPPGWVVFAVIAAGYSLDLGPVVKFFRATSPATLSGTVPIDSSFGIYYIGIAVPAASSSRLFPVPFSITFSVTPQQPVTGPQ